MSEHENTPVEAHDHDDEATRAIAAATPAPATTPAVTTPDVDITDASANSVTTAFGNMIDAMKTMADPFGVVGLTKEFTSSIATIVVTAHTQPFTLSIVIEKEIQRLTLLLIKHQLDILKIIPNASKHINVIFSALSKSDYSRMMDSSKVLLTMAQTIAPANDSVSSAFIKSLLDHPFFTNNLKQVNDVLDEVNNNLVGNEIGRYYDNITKLSALLFNKK